MMRNGLLLVLMGSGLVVSSTPADGLVNPTPIGTYRSGVFDDSAAEIPAYHAGTERLFVVNATSGVDIIDISDPSSPTLFGTIAAPGTNSVAVHGDIIALAVQDATKTNPGTVQFYNPAGGSLGPSATVGALPDMLIFTSDGTKVLVANEGEPNDDYTVDPEGSVSIVDISAGVGSAVVNTAGFSSFNSDIVMLQAAGVRIYGPGATIAQDLEPEYITIDGNTAYVGLQENNAIAVVDISTATITKINALGTKDHRLADSGFPAFDGGNSSNAFDASNQDGGYNPANWSTRGMYQPDAIASYQVDGITYIVTANEGDSREYIAEDEMGNEIDHFVEEDRVKDVTLDTTAFPDAPNLQLPENLGRLKLTLSHGDDGNDGDYEEIFSFGARSFSIFRAELDHSLTLVYDSGDDIERITHGVLGTDFNSTNDESASGDGRSDDKGPEPEAVAIHQIDDIIYGFIGLERVGGVLVYDITNPLSPSFVQYFNNRDFGIADVKSSVEGLSNVAIDLGPEGLLLISADDSPIGHPLLVVANEVSGTTSIHLIPEPAAATLLSITGLSLMGKRARQS